MQKVAKIIELVKMRIKANVAYSAFMWSYLIVGIIQVVIFYFIWTAVYAGKSSINGFTLKQMITYIILSRILVSQVSWGINIFISTKIRDGSIATDLLRPFDFQFYIYLLRTGDLLCYFLINGIPAFLFSIVAFGLQAPTSITSFVLFVVSLLIGVTISFFVEFFVGVLSFYSKNGWGLQYTKMAVLDFFSGAMVPLAFLPGWLNKIVNLLPFKDIIYTPISIYMGVVPDDQVVKVLVRQTIWLFALLVFTRIFYKIAVRKITVQGG